MYLKNKTELYTKTYFQKIKQMIQEADKIVIGAGSGLSTAAGFTYSGERFRRYFSDFQAKYQIEDMYSGGFYPFATLEEYWAWWSRHIYYNRYVDIPNKTYDLLYALVKDKTYFVVTTNVDHCFQKANFNKQQLFYMQGDYGLLQCSKACHLKTYDNEKLINQMLYSQHKMSIATNLIPKCPKCNANMIPNLRIDEKFVEDQGWHLAKQRYEKFLNFKNQEKIVFIEVGVGYNTPTWIKYPFWKMTNDYQNARYIAINNQEMFSPEIISEKSLLINMDINEVLSQLVNL